MIPPPLSVVVVGAGSAALRLAQTIIAESPTPVRVIILEANDYVGGRVRNFSFEGYNVEMGANWISVEETTNPIWEFAKKNGLRSNRNDLKNPDRIHVIDCTNVGIDSNIDGNGGPVITNQYLEQVKRFDDCYAKAKQDVNASFSSVTIYEDVNVESLLQQFGWIPTSPLDRAVEHNLLEVWGAETLSQLSSAIEMKGGEVLGQDEVFVEDQRGFNSIFGEIVRELEGSNTTTIRMETEVQRIQYVPGDTKVTAKDLRTGELIDFPADIVVSTVSLGVLQRGAIQFIPPLPRWKVDALNQVGMFNLAKVFAKFQTKLWPDKKEYIVFICQQRGYYPLWFRYQHSEDNILMCCVGGAQARRVESLSDEQIKDELEELFGTAFGRSKNCRPIAVAVTDWSRNPRFYGSYSWFPMGSFNSIPWTNFVCALTGVEKERAAPVVSLPNTLHFAGEAFSDKVNGWVQSGYLSGEQVARTIIQEAIENRA